MDWTILGIDPTDDKKAITAAYRQKLRSTNPEDKPEEFKALRAAYEEALRLADEKPAEPVPADTPLDRWLLELEMLYHDYAARIRTESWKTLMDADVCTALDTRPLAEEALLSFLLEHYHLPRSVWQTLDGIFSWTERVQELCETLPQEFVELCIVNGVRMEQRLSYEHFQPGRDGTVCDAYRSLYYECSQTPFEDRGPLLDRMESMAEQHPYGRAMRCQWYVTVGRDKDALEGFRALAAQYPDDNSLNTDYALMCIRTGSHAEAEAVLGRCLERSADDSYAKKALAEALAAQGRYADAKETLYEVIYACSDDPVAADSMAERIREWNASLIAQYEAGMPDTAMELSWCYLQNDDPDKAMETAQAIDPATADPFDYHNLMGKLCHHLDRYAEGAEHMEALVALLRQMKPDGTRKTDKRIARLPEMLQVLGACLEQSGQPERAREAFAESLALAPDDPKVLTVMSGVYHTSGEYEQAVQLLQHLTTVSPGSWFGYMMLAVNLGKLHRDAEAFDAINRALDLHDTDLGIYTVKMQILLRNNVFDEVHEILDFLKEAGAPEDLNTEFLHAQLLELEQHNDPAAFRAYQGIARRVEASESLLDAPWLYYRMANLSGKQSGHNRQEDRDMLLAMLDKGLSHDPHDLNCLRYKTWLLSHSGRLGEAIDLLRPFNTPSIRRELADLYFEDLDTYAAEALEIYSGILEQCRTPEISFYCAACCRSLGDDARAEAYANMALELDPGDIDAYNILAYIREAQGRNAEALAYSEQSLKATEEAGLFYDWLLGHKVQILCRMGRPLEALKTIEAAMARHADYNGWQKQFDVCCQFGLFDRAEQVLKQWAAARKNDPEQLKSTGLLYFYRGKRFNAAVAYGRVKHRMAPLEEIALRYQMAELEADHKRLLQLLEQRAKLDSDTMDVLLTRALVLHRIGAKAKAADFARQALELMDAKLTRHRDDEALLRTRRSAALAILGREAEARAELAQSRTLPLCKYCTYGRCKDADIYEAFVEEICGNFQKALQLHQAGQKNWPDELDFVSGEVRLKKKKGR